MSRAFEYPDDAERSPVIVDGLRTPWVKSGSDLDGHSAADLGTWVVRELLARAELAPDQVDEVVFGCVGPQAGEANVARVIGLRAGLPETTPAMSVGRNCASGLESIDEAARRIACGAGSVFVAGGVESMSSYPLIYGRRMTKLFARLARSRSGFAKVKALLGFRPSMLAPRVAILEGLTDPTCGLLMGQTAERLANEFGITRRDQDEFALRSHERASKAWAAEAFADEVFELYLPNGRRVERDNGPREEQSLEALAKLRPYFERREGSVTVGNSCPVTDGAAAVLVTSKAEAERRGWEILGRLRSSSVAGLSPARMGLGPALASPLALDACGLAVSDIDVWELNEAFAAQTLACMHALDSDAFARRELGREHKIGAPDLDRVNPQGGAIALGHPVGATGTRLVLTLLRQLRARNGGLGVATACIGGGQGQAQVWEAAA